MSEHHFREEAIAAHLPEDALHAPANSQPAVVPAAVAEACERLKTFGNRHGLSLGGMTIRELRGQARP